MTASCSRVMEPLGALPSEMPFSLAQAMPFSYQVPPPEVLTPSWRARMVIIIPRVVGAAGANVVREVPAMRPFSTA